MPLELANDLLVVSPHEEPPAASMVVRALIAANLGTAEYTPAPKRADAQAPSGPGARKRLGAFSVTIPGTQATGRIVVFSYTAPVTAGMSEGAFGALTRNLAAEDVDTLREGTLALDLRVRSSEIQALAALDWAMQTLRVLLDMTQGTAIDPAAQRCYSRANLSSITTSDALAHITIHDELWNAESRWLHTHGMQKFGRAELDLIGVPVSLEPEGRAFLRDVALGLAGGSALVAGGEIDMEDFGRVVAIGIPADVDHQAPYGRLRLADVPHPGERQSNSPIRLLIRTALAEVANRAAIGDTAGALDDIERVLAADPDDCEALTAKARLYLHGGQIMEALGIGEYIELRVPNDYRGPLIVGVALAALGRLREALHALERAIKCEPDAAEPFAVRAGVYERLGETQLAAVDRAHADYLAHA
ncbi:MAG: tetratricopeptide repeat protein [Ktedonobacterales bacterium]